MAKVLGVDYGAKRIGIAIGDSETRIASPLKTVAGRIDAAQDAKNVADLAAQHEAASIVVGLPLNMDGSEGEQARLTRRFAQELERASGLPVAFQDERLSSDAAKQTLAEAGTRGGRRRKAGSPIDRIAAAKILQAYFDRQ